MGTAALLGDLLPGTSRSFALSLRVLPEPLRAPLGITYLVARAADTIADTRALPPDVRLGGLRALRRAIEDRAATVPIPAEVDAAHPPAERMLLARLPEVLAAYHALEAGDHARARTVLLVLTGAMEETLARFPPERSGGVGALETLADLDRYTYLNAGCVGEFWTDVVMAHRRRCGAWDRARMRALGARYGQGLQLVNVLRDLPRDLRLGRCYLPRAELALLGLEPAELLDPRAIARLRPLLARLADRASGWLADGLAYTLAIPRAEPRLRLACAWPLLLGLATLARLQRADDLLDPRTVVKVPRPAVRRLLLRSVVRVWSDRGLAAEARRAAGGSEPGGWQAEPRGG